MKNERKSVFLIGMNIEESGVFKKIFESPEYEISTIFSLKDLISCSDSAAAECFIIDYKVWSDNSFDMSIPELTCLSHDIPLIFTGPEDDESALEKSFSKGAYDYISYPLNGKEVLARINNQISLYRRSKFINEVTEARTANLKNSNILLQQSIDEYKKILKEIQDNETLFLTIALNIPNSYLLIIEKNFTISFAAGREFKKSGIDPWRFIGIELEKVLKEQFENVKKNLEKSFDGEEISFELELNRQFLLHRAVPLFSSNDTVVRILVVAENITERKLSESRIKDSLKEKETLLKEIHHRVKNNMQLVYSMVNLQAECLDNDDVFDIFKVLQSRIYSMSLVHEKLYHHKHFSKINFSEYIKELVEQIRNSFSCGEPGNNIRIELILQEENFTIEKAIPCGLILNELVMNSFKHASLISGKGLIRIIFEKSESNTYRLTVSDNGCGLPDGFDVNKAESMGMTLVRELVSQLHGDISISSGEETVFTVVFGQTQKKHEAHIVEISGNGNKNILLVEDERIISRMLRKILEESGYNIVDSVSSGREAIESAARNNPDLILMDIMLEDEIDGVEAASVIIKEHNCPIIFLTGNSDPATLKSALDINPFGMLTKPIERFQLIDVIESVFK